MNLDFTKMHGLGNDFVVINGIDRHVDLTPDQIRTMADRHTGIGFDQLLLLQPSVDPAADVRYRIFNADGNEVEQCGNGARCIGQYLHENAIVNSEVIAAETVKGIIRIYMDKPDTVRVNMGVPRFEPADIPLKLTGRQPAYHLQADAVATNFYALSMGNPHAVILVDDVATAEVEKWGKLFQQHEMFPQSVNVGFLQVLDRNNVLLRVYERGAGETLACGTGACAAVVAGIMANKLDNEVTVGLNRGKLSINWDGEGSGVWMSGPATTVYEGQITL
jgi:diaminopimelate epimerase